MPTIAIIGSGPLGSGAIGGFANSEGIAKLSGSEIHIFERSLAAGIGTPYNNTNNDPEHLLNVRAGSSSMPDGDFLAWVKANSEDDGIIATTLHGILTARLQQKFRARFGEEFVEGKKYEAERLALCRTRDISMRRLMSYCRDGDQTFHPRIVYGIYTATVFAENLRKLEAAGVAVVQHLNTEVTSLLRNSDKTLNITFRTATEEEQTLEFDSALIATGSWTKEEKLDGDVNHRHLKAYPVGPIHNKLEQLIAEAKRTGGKIINIAIEGSGLSAVDVARSILSENIGPDGKFIPRDDGIEIKVDIVSRSGKLHKVKGSANGTAAEVAKYWYKEGDKIDEKYPAKIIQDKINRLKKDEAGNIHLWQLFQLFGETLRDAYTKAGRPERSEEFSRFLEFISTHKDDYAAITEYFFQILSGTLNRDPFITLEQDLRGAENGDCACGDLVWAMIYAPFDMVFMCSELPVDERIYRLEIFQRLHSVHAEGMPPRSAKEMLTLHRARVLEAAPLGHNPTPKKVDADEITLGGKRYDMVVSATGFGVDARENPSPLLKSMIDHELLLFDQELFCKAEEFPEKMDELGRKIGSDNAIKILKYLKKDGNGNFVYSRGEIKTDAQAVITKYSSPADVESDEEEVTVEIITNLFLPKAGGIFSSRESGRAVAEKIIGKIPGRDVVKAEFEQPKSLVAETKKLPRGASTSMLF